MAPNFHDVSNNNMGNTATKNSKTKSATTKKTRESQQFDEKIARMIEIENMKRAARKLREEMEEKEEQEKTFKAPRSLRVNSGLTARLQNSRSISVNQYLDNYVNDDSKRYTTAGAITDQIIQDLRDQIAKEDEKVQKKDKMKRSRELE